MGIKILKNDKEYKLSTNTEKIINVDISDSCRLLPVDEIDEKIDEYKQYLKEKEKSHKYRLSFTINPICTNVLFNHVTEVTYKEGSKDCININNFNQLTGVTDVMNYVLYKNNCIKNGNVYKLTNTGITKVELIRDTGYSHKDIGDLEYHCGYDIFNNHLLRKKEFSIINKLGDCTGETRNNFNTIYDLKRDYNGNIINEKVVTGYTNNIPSWGTKNLHQYQIDTLYSFSESIIENLIEENGWFGFLNKTTLDIPNYIFDCDSGKTKYNISLNKVMNSSKSGEFIDMYPDRTLYSFVPKVNKHRNNRLEPNWDYCLTYPHQNFYDNELVQYNNEEKNIHINGLKCEIVGLSVTDENIYDIEDGKLITLKTKIKNTFKKGSVLQFEVIGSDKVEKVYELISVNNIIGKQDDGYYFEIYGDDLIEVLNHFENPSSVEIRVRQVINGVECEYYFRKFAKIPNRKLGGTSFNSMINKIGFSKNIYSDDNVQILFNDDIEIGDLRDNLGRELSEIYLTIVKNNKGYKIWYGLDDKIPQSYGHEDVTFSHCFGEITSGVDILDVNEFDYNIHKLHNISQNILTSGVTTESSKNQTIDDYIEGLKKNIFNGLFVDGKTPQTLEKDISIDKDEYYGDIVEFSPSLLDENILEIVYHRFNTAQREYYKNGDNKYYDIVYDEIKYDDFDLQQTETDKTEFTIITKNYNTIYYNEKGLLSVPANIAPEGYYYQPHYKIQLKEYGDKVNQGNHTRMTIVKCEKVSGTTSEYKIITNKNYYLEIGGTLYLYDINTNEKNEAIIISVGAKPFTEATIRFNKEILDSEGQFKYVFFKPNVEQPKNSYELTDGSGRYLWREILKDSEYNVNNNINKQVFTNGVHYINKDIIFYLKRQDCDGAYSLNNTQRGVWVLSNLVIEGYGVDNSDIEYNEIDIEGLTC